MSLYHIARRSVTPRAPGDNDDDGLFTPATGHVDHFSKRHGLQPVHLRDRAHLVSHGREL